MAGGAAGPDLLELDLPDHLGRHSGGDHPRRQVLSDHGVRPDHAPLADLDAAGDDAPHAEPAVEPIRTGPCGSKPCHVIGLLALS